MIVADALKYVQHPGFIEFYLIDAEKKALYDQWENDMRQYEIDLKNYEKVNAQYNAEKSAFDTKVAAAKKEAERRYKAQQDAAIKRAQAEAQAKQSNSSSNSILGAVLSGINQGLIAANAAASVKYEPILNQVLAERDLLVPPSAPYNPRPSCPSEPSTGAYWKNVLCCYPNNYEYVDFDAIKEAGKLADAKIDGKWGVVDSKLNTIVPCKYNKRVIQGRKNI